MALFKFIGRSNDAIFIIDNDKVGQPSVTNRAEEVVIEIDRCWGSDYRIIYRDSIGVWDELKREKWKFIAFVPLSEIDKRRYQEWLVPAGEKIG